MFHDTIPFPEKLIPVKVELSIGWMVKGSVRAAQPLFGLLRMECPCFAAKWPQTLPPPPSSPWLAFSLNLIAPSDSEALRAGTGQGYGQDGDWRNIIRRLEASQPRRKGHGSRASFRGGGESASTIQLP